MAPLASADPTTAERVVAGRSLAAQRARERWLTLAVGLCAAGPIIASTLRALVDGWIPAGDQAIIATRAYEVLTSRSPLVGQYSDSTALTHHAVYSPGPMLYWLLAIPARIGAPGSLAVAMGLANAACVVGVVALARRRGGLLFMFAAALAVVLMSRSLSPEGLHDVWNPSAGLLPFALLVFLCWSLACGEHRLLPMTALVASFVVQCQFTYLLPSLGLLAVAVAGLVASRRAARGGADPAPPVRGWALAALLVAVVCWTPPLLNELKGSPGNITAIARTVSANHSTLGATIGWRAVVHAIGIPPWWLEHPASAWEHKNEVRTAPAALASVSALLALCALAGLAAAGIARRRVEVWSAALIGLALCAAIALVAAETPTSHLLSATLGYTLWWASPAGMFVWLALAYVPLCALSRRGLPAGIGRAPAAVAGVGAVALVAVAVAAGERADEHVDEYAPLAKLTTALQHSVPGGRTVALESALGNSTFRFKMAARFVLLRRGVRPLSPGKDVRLGAWYELARHSYDCTVYLRDGSTRPDPQAVLIGGFTYRRTFPVTVWMWPAGCPRGPSA
jgi:hypothetical protein